MLLKLNFLILKCFWDKNSLGLWVFPNVIIPTKVMKLTINGHYCQAILSVQQL